MVEFGPQEAVGLLSIVILAAASAFVARWALASRGVARDLRRVNATLADFGEREEINRLRHRDFDAFLAKLNERRARLGQAPLTKEYLLPHRYDLMYSVDAGDIDATALEKLKKRVEKAAKTGEEPVAPSEGT